MQTVALDGSFADWREKARQALARAAPPVDILWHDLRLDPEPPGLLASVPAAAGRRLPSHEAGARPARVPARFVELAETAALHRDREKWPLLYRLLWRIVHGEPELLQVSVDEDVSAAERMVRNVRRDAHKMTAFVRFRKVETDSGEHYVAWHRPDHFVVRRTAPFFVDRFRVQKWSILTPDECAHWDGASLRFSEGVPASAAPQGDALESLWKTYYASIFNPARVKVEMMKREMPVRHWATLPEAELIPELLDQAAKRTDAMMTRSAEATSAAQFLPRSSSLAVLQSAAAACRGCGLYCNATQTVFGEGPVNARVMLVGEQPGDEEDQQGRPFVGPAGQVLNDALIAAGIERDRVYVTNAVKHFKFEMRGKRRIHARPSLREAAACRPWLEAELSAVRPHVLVCLGATAAQSLLGTTFRITSQRGVFVPSKRADYVIATWHPSAILRAADADAAERMRSELIADLKLAMKAAREA